MQTNRYIMQRIGECASLHSGLAASPVNRGVKGMAMEVTNLNDIAAFASVVKHGSYTMAAKQLGLTRSAIGRS